MPHLGELNAYFSNLFYRRYTSAIVFSFKSIANTNEIFTDILLSDTYFDSWAWQAFERLADRQLFEEGQADFQNVPRWRAVDQKQKREIVVAALKEKSLQ